MPGCRRVGTPGAGGLARGGADSAGGASAAFQQQQQYLAVEHTRWTVSSPRVVTHSPSTDGTRSPLQRQFRGCPRHSEAEPRLSVSGGALLTPRQVATAAGVGRADATPTRRLHTCLHLYPNQSCWLSGRLLRPSQHCSLI